MHDHALVDRPKRRITAIAVLPLVAVSGCTATESSSGWTGVVTDSAGVQLVENASDGTWTPEAAWAVEEVLSVGGHDAGLASQFGTIAGLDIGPQGRMYVADTQAQSVKVFDASGAYLRSIGRAGSGPGEFDGNIAGVFVVGEDVIVPDLANQRISRFNFEGTLISDHRQDMARGIPLRFDMAGDRLVAQRRLRALNDSAGPARDAIVALPLDGSAIDTLARLAPGQSVQITGELPKIRPFAPDPVWDADPSGRLVTAMTDAWRFEVRDSAGRLERVISRPYERGRVTARDRQSVEDALRRKYDEQGVPPEASRAVIEAMEFADYLPALTSVALGPNDSLWVQIPLSDEELATRGATLAVDDMGSRRWGVFDADGRYMGTVQFPTRFRPIRSVGSLFYGISTDDLDVQSVKVYRVETG